MTCKKPIQTLPMISLMAWLPIQSISQREQNPGFLWKRNVIVELELKYFKLHISISKTSQLVLLVEMGKEVLGGK